MPITPISKEERATLLYKFDYVKNLDIYLKIVKVHKHMTKKEVSINTTWDEFEMGTFRLFVEVLNQYIRVLLFQEHKPKPRISAKMLQSINDILVMDKNEFDRLGDILGVEVYQQSKIKEIHIDQDNDKFDGVFSEVIIDAGANDLTSVIVKDAKFICVNEGTYFDTLEVSDSNTEQKTPSQEERQKVIDMMLSS